MNRIEDGSESLVTTEEGAPSLLRRISPATRRGACDEELEATDGAFDWEYQIAALKDSDTLNEISSRILKYIDSGKASYLALEKAINGDDMANILSLSEELSRLCAEVGNNDLFRASFQIHSYAKQQRSKLELLKSMRSLRREFERVLRNLPLFP